MLGAEVNNGNAISVTSAIEYPAGVYTNVTCSGSSPCIFADGVTGLTDSVSVDIFDGAKFWTDTLVTGSGGNNFPRTSVSAPGAALFYLGGGADEASQYQTAAMTVNQTVVDNQTGKTAYYPVAIIGTTSRPSFCLLGDSRTKGITDQVDATYDIGNLARSVGPLYAYMNLGMGSDRADAFLFGGAKRQALIDTYCTVTINEYGFNTFGNGSATVSGEEAIEKTIAARFNGRRYSIATFAPNTSSTDFWATVGNQSAGAAATNINTRNGHARAGSIISGVTASDVATPVMSALDSGLWGANGYARHFTTDGTHESQAGDIAIAKSGNLNPMALATAPPISASYPSMTLTAIGTPSYVTGKFSNALATGAQAYTDGVVPGIPPMTMDAWFKNSNTSALQFMLSAGPIALEQQITTGFVCSYRNFAVRVCSTTSIADGSWHHVEIDLRQAGGAYEVYIDGVSAFTDTISRGLASWLNASQSFGVGYNAIANNTGATPYLGSIDEVAIWSIERHSSGFTPPASAYTGSESGLVGLWHFDGDLTGTRGPAGM